MPVIITAGTPYVVGNDVRVSGVFTDINGAFGDPDTINCYVKDPNGTVTKSVYLINAALVKDSTGKYHLDVNATLAGEWFYRIEGIGTLQAASESSFIVRASEVF